MTLICAADEEDGQSIEMAFSKKKVEDRKRWLSAFKPGTYLDQSVDTISYKDFVHKVRALAGLLHTTAAYIGENGCWLRLRYEVLADSASTCCVYLHGNGVEHSMRCDDCNCCLPATGLIISTRRG